jgi:hypothetical protein
MKDYDYCLLACGTWVVLYQNQFISYATDEEDARTTAEKYNKEEAE